MSNFDSDPNFDGDWEDKGGLTWNEFDWRNYLNESDKEIARFLTIYNSLKDQPDHLDETAHLMGWEVEDWSNPVDGEGFEGDDFDDLEDPSLEDSEYEDMDPYTLHKHPVFIVTRALHEFLRGSWEHYMMHSQQHVTPQVAWSLANSLHRSESFAILALQSLDLGDYALTICHLKSAMASLNQTLSTLQGLVHEDARFLQVFRQEMYVRLFDLREIWLRVMQDCRDEVSRRNGGGR